MSKIKRVHTFDVIRGALILSMIGFHTTYDLVFLFHQSLTWFRFPLISIWRLSIALPFLMLAGAMSCLSRNNLKRSARYGLLALAIFVVTSLFHVDTPISFGIIFCMAACTLIVSCVQTINIPKRALLVLMALSLLLFLCSWDISKGILHVGLLDVQVPSLLYDSPYLAWLGFPDAGFTSGDYYPLLPYLGIYLFGFFSMRWFLSSHSLVHIVDIQCEPLEFIGRHPLMIYVLHQPIIYALLFIVFQ